MHQKLKINNFFNLININLLNYKNIKNIITLIINIININLLFKQLSFKRKKTQLKHFNNIYY